jgi:hypothetical protein
MGDAPVGMLDRETGRDELMVAMQVHRGDRRLHNV